MADTPGPVKAITRRTFGTMFRLDPEGNVQMTWQTLALLLFAMYWATAVYLKVGKIDGLEAEQRVHREVLIKKGLLEIAKVAE